MIWLLAGCALGVPVGFLLLWRIPLCGETASETAIQMSIVIPARNEEHSLPKLLGSVSHSGGRVREVIVVDDQSSDATAVVSVAHGAVVIRSCSLPDGWTGKTWACVQGAKAAGIGLLLFVDADTWFEPQGIEHLAALYGSLSDHDGALSILPYHVMRAPYEQLSLFFNLLMAFGAGGFGTLGGAKLFGQSLLIDSEIYRRCGGHSSVRRAILENVAMSSNIIAVGGKCNCLGGKGVLNIRMFPTSFSQLCEGWTKAFADGAAASDGGVLAATIVWLTALCSTAVLLAIAPLAYKGFAAGLYLCFALQLGWQSRQLGTYKLLTCLIYPMPMLFFLYIFGQSLFRRVFKRKVTWRGRSL